VSDLNPDGDRLVDKLRPWTRGGSIFWLAAWTILYIAVVIINGPKVDILVLFGLGEIAAIAFVIRAWTRRDTRDAP
jgi:ABC-type protease/lipase transport system fused ATPase/permease subunit